MYDIANLLAMNGIKFLKSLKCNQSKINLKLNLTCGQAFRWRCLEDNTLVGVFSHRVWVLRQDKKHIYYKVIACEHSQYKNEIHSGKAEERKPKTGTKRSLNNGFSNSCNCCEAEETLLSEYLQLNFSAKSVFSQWAKNDKNFANLERKQIHVLQQEPLETLFSFMCSVNNAIYRIVPLIEKMCIHFGKKLLELDGKDFYDFPKLDALAVKGTEETLRQLGFGYRAQYIADCAKAILHNGGENWLNGLSNKPYLEAREELTKLPGIGLKVADCVCLMSLKKPEAVPIDTHIRQIAVRDYQYKLTSKSLTPKSYSNLSEFFRAKWGSHAGWAQAILFVAEIKESPATYDFCAQPKSKKLKRPKRSADGDHEP